MSQILEMTADDTTVLTATPTRPGWWRRMLLDIGYNLAALPISLAAFVVAVVGISLGAGLLVIFLGLLVLVVAVWCARGFAQLERLRLRSQLGRPAPAPTYVRAAAEGSWLRRTLTPLRDPSSWLDLAWSVLGFATGITAFVVTVGWVAGALGGLSYWFWQQFIPFGPDDTTLAELIGLGSGRTPESILNFVLGIVALVTLPLAVRLATLLHASLATVLLCGRAQLQADVRRAEGGRSAARSAEASALRRLERDIHDGPQQRLVRLQMDLGRAGRQVDRDPEEARRTIDAALRQARDAVDELRSLSRGIAPPVLVDRGLAAALEEAFARSTVPVNGTVDLGPEDLPAYAQSTVYFVVSEGLTNVAKHSRASRAEVRVVRHGDRIGIEVTDDGVGGADLAKGRGLAGLSERARGADGTLELSSPAGGPTMLRAEVGCG